GVHEESRPSTLPSRCGFGLPGRGRACRCRGTAGSWRVPPAASPGRTRRASLQVRRSRVRLAFFRLQSFVKPPAGISEFPLQGSERQTEGGGSLLVGKTPKELHLDDRTPVRMRNRKLIEQTIDGK